MDKGSFLTRLNVRNFFWNYPGFFVSLIRVTNPLFYIVLAFVLSYSFFLLFTSDFVKILVEGRDSRQVIEGTVGGLSSVNPMYVTNNSVDKDFYALIYDKFLDFSFEGDPISGIAYEWEQVSELEYVFKIREDIYWNDGVKLTADDIVWNIETAITLASDYGQDTYGNALEGVIIEKINDYEVKFILEESNSTFWEAVSVYIIPKHFYEDFSLRNFSATKNLTRPLGSGVYSVDTISTNGIILFSDEGNIQEYRYLFFDDYESLNLAIKNNRVDIVSHVDLARIDNLEEYPFLSVKGFTNYHRQKLISFNNRRDRLKNPSLRQALYHLIDIEELMDIAGINGVVSNGPIPEVSWAFSSDVENYNYDPEAAKELLDSVGYVRESEYYITPDDGRILSFELKYFESDINVRIVSALESLLRAEGVFLQTVPLSFDQILMEVLPTRDFELILSDVQITIDPDQYNLWHSLRMDHPHLNISGYTYSRVDILLERARQNLNKDERKEDYVLFQRYLMSDAPVIFLYHPESSFIIRDGLNGFNLEGLTIPSDRYVNVGDWLWD